MNEQSQRDPRALNAYRHGITGQIFIQTPVEREAYELHCRQYHRDLAPVGVREVQLTQTIADDQWRLNRAKSMEPLYIAMGIHNSKIKDDTDPDAFGSSPWPTPGSRTTKSGAHEPLRPPHPKRHRQEPAVLRQLQQERQAALQKAAEEMTALAQLAESKVGNFNPEQDFPCEALPKQFVFSIRQIARLATHYRRLTEAKTRPQPTAKRPKRAKRARYSPIPNPHPQPRFFRPLAPDPWPLSLPFATLL